MTHIDAMKMALEALESYHGYMEPLTTVFGGPRVPAEQSTTGKVEKAITALRQAIEQPAVEPTATQKDAVFDASIEFIRTLTGMEPPPIEIAPPEVLKPFREFTEKVCAIFSTRPQPAIEQAEKQKPVAYRSRIRNTDGQVITGWVVHLNTAENPDPRYEIEPLYTHPQPKVKQEPVAMQMDVIVVNLVREGINKHRARELAEHFIKTTSPQPQKPWVGLTDEEIDQGLLRSDYALQTAHAWRSGVVFAMTKLKEKNT